MKYAAFKEKFIVAQLFAYGWDTPAHTEDDNGNDIPTVFDTQDEALADRDEYITDISEAIARGDMNEDSRIGVEDLKIFMADMDEDGNVTVYEVGDKNNVLTNFNVEKYY